ncbi:Aste57867_6958 [Aphanomyces stellatus]|uniref:Aste57867_6958 protein n=1 Tax=Aphanomyces stellatus TaxID=120398 RepID=A0A485KFB1_9STRA|nr:hypothetical protein As57867_006936 [Aphanomyces stellatus]VFT83910.1 Aste57867_6958 [Aphanomyces stellatus]
MPVVFVTVGTTCFDEMIQAVDTPEVLSILAKRGYTEVVFQIGRGEYEPKATSHGGDDGSRLTTTCYRFNPQYKDDIRRASLVLSHAGAGSIMDTLMEKKHLIVIPNNKLMDNHQEELAVALAERHHLVPTTCALLAKCIASVNLDALIPYPAIDEDAFPACVDAMMQGGPKQA